MVNLIQQATWEAAMSDTPEELKRSAYMEANGLSHCENCHTDVPDEDTTTDLGECICNACRPEVARTCKGCGETMGNWNGSDTPTGFWCFGCQNDMDQDELRQKLMANLADAGDLATDR